MVIAVLLLVILLILVLSNSKRTSELEFSLNQLRQQLAHLRSELEVLKDASAQRRPGTMESPAPAQPQPVFSPTAPSAQTAPHPVAPPPVPPAPIRIPAPVAQVPPVMQPAVTFAMRDAEAPPQPMRTPTRTRDTWEMLIGGNLFNRIGAILLIIAAALFITLKLKNDVFTPTPTLRFIVGIASGIISLWAGGNSHKKGLHIFGQGLVGAGIGIFYLTMYGAYGFFHLLPLPITLVGMLLVTLVAIWQAIRYDSLAIALIGWFGGFCTPFLLCTPARDLSIFVYLLFFQLGLLALPALKPRWSPTLEGLAIFSVYAVVFFRQIITPHPSPSIVLFMAVYCGLFLAYDLVRQTRYRAMLVEHRLYYFTFNAVCFGLAIYLLMSRTWPALLPIALCSVAIVHGTLGLVLAIKRWSTPWAEQGNLLAAIVFLALATYLKYRGLLLIDLWSVEAAALVYCGLRWQRAYVWTSALMLFSVTFLKLLLTVGALAYAPIAAFTPVINLRCFTFAVLAGALALCAHLFKRYHGKSSLSEALHYAWSIIVAVLITVEINDAFRKLHADGHADLFWAARYMVMAVSWTLYSLPLVSFGLRKQNRPLLIVGIVKMMLGVLFLLCFGLRYAPLHAFIPIVNMRAIPFLLVMIGLGLHARWLRRERADLMLEIIKGSVAILLFELLTVETVDLFAKIQQSHAGGTYAFVLHLTLPIIWTLYGVGMLIYARHWNSSLLMGFAIIAQWVAMLWIVLSGAVYEPIAHFVPLWNLRTAAYLAVAGGLMGQYRLLRDQRVAGSATVNLRGLLRIFAVLCVFELVSVETLDYFRHWQAAAILDVPAIPVCRMMALAAVWAVYALLITWIGIVRKYREWVGAGLIALALGVFVAIFWGWSYAPIAGFTTLLNYRTLLFLSVLLMLVLHIPLLPRVAGLFASLAGLPGIVRVLLALLGLQLCTAEVLNYFSKAALTPMAHLADIRQMILCVVWVLYSLLVLAYGIWKRQTALRLVAIGIFIATLLITCGYYIFVHNLFYRMVAIVALALSLLGVSYLYQRYRGLIIPRQTTETRNADV